MKKFTKLTTLIALLAISLFSCKKEEEQIPVDWDICAVLINIYVEDSLGNNLVSSEFEGNILSDSIYITLDGKDYPLSDEKTEYFFGNDGFSDDFVDTRYYMPSFYGVYKVKNLVTEKEFLEVGEFDGTLNWNNSFTIHWGDGTSDKIRFKRTFAVENKNQKPIISDLLLYLNDEKVDEIKIIKDKK